jgi:hypothetical protein
MMQGVVDGFLFFREAHSFKTALKMNANSATLHLRLLAWRYRM